MKEWLNCFIHQYFKRHYQQCLKLLCVLFCPICPLESQDQHILLTELPPLLLSLPPPHILIPIMQMTILIITRIVLKSMMISLLNLPPLPQLPLHLHPKQKLHLSPNLLSHHYPHPLPLPPLHIHPKLLKLCLSLHHNQVNSCYLLLTFTFLCCAFFKYILEPQQVPNKPLATSELEQNYIVSYIFCLF